MSPLLCLKKKKTKKKAQLEIKQNLMSDSSFTKSPINESNGKW